MTKIDEIEKYYDNCAETYDIKHGVVLAGQDYNFKRYYRPFLDKWCPNEGPVLELGCGTGVYTAWLNQRGCSVHAIDISSKMVDKAKKRCPKTNFFVGDCEDPARVIGNAVPKGGYEAIIGINTFSYYINKADSLKKFFDLLNPGGRLIFIDMNGKSPYYAMMTMLDINEMKQWCNEISESNIENLTKLLKDTGYILEKIDRFALVPNGIRPLPLLFLKPIDIFIGSLPFIKSLAMRIAYVAKRPD